MAVGGVFIQTPPGPMVHRSSKSVRIDGWRAPISSVGVGFSRRKVRLKADTTACENHHLQRHA
jgi:hypothetical protein